MNPVQAEYSYIDLAVIDFFFTFIFLFVWDYTLHAWLVNDAGAWSKHFKVISWVPLKIFNSICEAGPVESLLEELNSSVWHGCEENFDVLKIFHEVAQFSFLAEKSNHDQNFSETGILEVEALEADRFEADVPWF